MTLVVIFGMEREEAANMANTVKVTISISPELLDRTDSFADENGMTRSGCISLALKQYLQAAEVMPSMSQIVGQFANFMGNAVGMSKEERALADKLENSLNEDLAKRSSDEERLKIQRKKADYKDKYFRV